MSTDDERTLELARGELAERLKRQGEEIKSLDTKAQLLVGFAITALTLVLTAAPIPLAGRVVSGLFFSLSVVFGVISFGVWRYDDPVDAAELTSQHVDDGYEELLVVVVGSNKAAIDANEDVIAERVKHWKMALACLAIAGLVGVVGLAVGGLR